LAPAQTFMLTPAPALART